MSCMIWYWCPCKCILYSLMTCNNSSLLPTKLYWLFYSDWFTSYLISALIPYHSHLLVLLSHVVIVVNLFCVEGLMEDRCTSNKHSRKKSLYYYKSLARFAKRPKITVYNGTAHFLTAFQKLLTICSSFTWPIDVSVNLTCNMCLFLFGFKNRRTKRIKIRVRHKTVVIIIMCTFYTVA